MQKAQGEPPPPSYILQLWACVGGDIWWSAARRMHRKYAEETVWQTVPQIVIPTRASTRHAAVVLKEKGGGRTIGVGAC